eukprot:Polyplicarium_translucidae@DN1409_c0_g1_i3.p1
MHIIALLLLIGARAYHCPGGDPPCGDVVVEFLQILDLSGSFADDIVVARDLIPGVFNELKATYPGSRFGLAAHIDKPLSPFGAAGNYCWQLVVPLTEDVGVITTALASLTATGGYDSPEAQLHALMQAGLDPSIGWTPPGGTVDGHNVLRIIGLSTDAVFHEEGDAAFLGPNDGDATVDCAGEDYPSVTQMAAAVAAAEAALLFEVVDFVSSDYTDLLDSSDLPGTVVSILEDSSNIANAIKEGVDALCA